MATMPVPFWAQPGNLLPSDLSRAREAFVERANAAALRAQRRCRMEGMPFRLIEASCFLADAGVVAPPCAGEEFFGWDISASRRYLDGLDPTARAAEIEAGRKMLFEARNAICPDIAAMRRESAQVVDIMEARWAANSRAYFAQRDAGKAVARG
jgi:hypothetical protein